MTKEELIKRKENRKEALNDIKSYKSVLSDKSVVDEKVSTIASMGSFVISLASFVLMCIFAPKSAMNIVTGIYLINVIFDNFIVYRMFGAEGKRIADIYCVAFLMLTMPILWFWTGGFKGIGGVWILFAVVYCIYGVQNRFVSLMQRLFGFEVLGMIILTVVRPDMVGSLSGKAEVIISGFSIVGISVYLETVNFMQIAAYSNEKREMEGLRDDLTAHYEETIAMNEQLISTTEKLEVANKTQKSFTASMNHEMRAPLNGIEGCLQILLMDDSISGEAKETLRNALTASKTINETINDLLDFSKLDEGKFEIVKRQFDLRDVLDNLSTIFKPQASAKNLKFIIQIPKDTRVSLVADNVRIQQIMTNLISNGVKYTKAGTVTMSVTTERGHLKFEVKDTGQGMSQECLDVLFDPFTRFNLKENAYIQGTGLGMNIVSNMIKAMKGSITVESEVGVGTTFHVDIPIMFYDSGITYLSPREIEKNDFSNVDLSRFKVLCVDDTEINRTVFKGMLKKSGAYVVTAENGKKAVEICEEQDFDYIFLDHMMPEMDGLETMDNIRKIRQRFTEIPIIIFTGNAGDEYQKLYKDRGANGYLLKPIMVEELMACFGL